MNPACLKDPSLQYVFLMFNKVAFRKVSNVLFLNFDYDVHIHEM